MSYLKIKSIADRVLAMTLLIVILIIPISLLVMLAIFIEDPGPVFFAQERIGKNGKPFKVYKFRSMYCNADQKIKENIETGVTDKLNFKNDANTLVTNVGKFIRKTSLDELPQLWNIIKGDMAIVGPRPLQEFEIIEFQVNSSKEDLMKKRLEVKPGLLCYWQLTPNKNEMPFDKRIDLDILYVENITAKIDIAIILKGFVTVLRGANL